jgi:hypothetical protein
VETSERIEDVERDSKEKGEKKGREKSRSES